MIIQCIPCVSLHFKAERRPPPRSESFRDKTRESLEEGECLFSLNHLFAEDNNTVPRFRLLLHIRAKFFFFGNVT